jgi:phage tail sheath gpL-like
MPEQIQKLSPDRDLQCFFYQPSAVAALSGASAAGFTVSGTWRQQFDWTVIEWNRDNVYEHPLFRNLPDGDLSGLTLTYDETRDNCIPLDSALYATVDWPSLRVWATPAGGTETIYYVPLAAHAAAITGSYQCAYADFTLSGTVVVGDYVGLSFLTEAYTYEFLSGDILANAAQAITDSVNAFSAVMKATRTGATIRLYYTGGATIASSTTGANGNRFSVYSYSTGAAVWDAGARIFANGTSPTAWRVTLDFSTLQGTITPDLSGTLYTIPTNLVRKMRWTYAADLQAAAFARSEFSVAVANWMVTGTNRTYSVAGPGSLRIEDHDASMVFSGAWTEVRGNYSGGTIHQTTTPGDSLSCTYNAPQSHNLYIGLRYTGTGGVVSIVVDGQPAVSVNLAIPAEDVLFRYSLGTFSAGSHTVVATHAGAAGTEVYFDFLELASPSADLPVIESQPVVTLATDWDTLHCISLPPERTAWMLTSLNFIGRANHYVGALWFYELVRVGHVYASATVTFSGTPAANAYVTVTLGQTGQPPSSDTILQKQIHVGDTADTIALAFAQELNRGYTGVWASAAGSVLTIAARTMGLAGDANTLAVTTTSGGFTATASGLNFAGGADGNWRTDLTASPALNRAVRDWSAAYFAALVSYGIDAAASFSMELQHGDPSAAAGIAQMGPAGDPILLPTPSLQTNFSPTSLAFWKVVYEEMAAIQAAAGLTPYLQFGEVQWWYFPNDGLGTSFSGMPFYDAWNLTAFAALYGHSLATITLNTVDPTAYPDEAAYLPTVIGNFTNAIMTFVRGTLPACRFEVLYPTDVNQTAFNRAINYPASAWTPAALACLKTEAFGFTFGRNLDQVWATLDFGSALGFTAAQRSHLVGAGDSTAAWLKEVRAAEGKRFESVVLFAIDQFCLIGYDVPLPDGLRRSFRTGG